MLSVSVGVPPLRLTVTASLKLTVSGTTVPGPSSAVGAAIEDTEGAVVSICRMPAGLVTAPERMALLLAASCSVAPFRLSTRHRQVGGVLAGRHRVAEGQRMVPVPPV